MERVPHAALMVLGVRALLGQTTLSRSGLGANNSDGPSFSSRGHLCSLSGRGFLPFLPFFLLAISVSCHPN
jgi:hypothetical protein